MQETTKNIQRHINNIIHLSLKPCTMKSSGLSAFGIYWLCSQGASVLRNREKGFFSTLRGLLFQFLYVRSKPRNGWLAKMVSFRHSKQSDSKRCSVEVRWGIFIVCVFLFLRAVVNISIQTLIISPWLLIWWNFHSCSWGRLWSV